MWRPVCSAGHADGVLGGLGAAVGEEHHAQCLGVVGVGAGVGDLDDQACRLAARVVGVERGDGAQPAGLLLDRGDELGVLVADVDVDQLAGEVEVAVAVLVPEPAALGAGDDERVERALRAPRVEHVGAIVGEGVGRAWSRGAVIVTIVFVHERDCVRTESSLCASAQRDRATLCGPCDACPGHGSRCRLIDVQRPTSTAACASSADVVIRSGRDRRFVTDVATDRVVAVLHVAFTALGARPYHGESTTEPDGAGKLMMALHLDQAAKDSRCASRCAATTSAAPRRRRRLLHGSAALAAGASASKRPDAVAAVAPYYGVHPVGVGAARLVGDRGRRSTASTPSSTLRQLRKSSVQLGRTAPRRWARTSTLHVHPGTRSHAFFNDTRPRATTPTASVIALDAP